MSRLIVDVTAEQHQTIKAIAAMEGKTIKDYILERVLPSDQDDDNSAWDELKMLLHQRMTNAEKHGISKKSIADITKEAINDLGEAE